MAGEPEFFYIYKVDRNRAQHRLLVQRRRRSRTPLRSRGALTSRQIRVRSLIPDGWETGWIRDPDDGTWRQLAVSDLDELGQRKAAAIALHGALLAWESGVEAVSNTRSRLLTCIERSSTSSASATIGRTMSCSKTRTTLGRRRNRSRGLTP